MGRGWLLLWRGIYRLIPNNTRHTSIQDEKKKDIDKMLISVGFTMLDFTCTNNYINIMRGM